MNRFHDGEVLHGDTSSHHTGLSYRHWAREHRTVYGGGGITPDIFVSFDTSYPVPSITLLYVNGTLNRFIYPGIFSIYPPSRPSKDRQISTPDITMRRRSMKH